MAGGRALGLRHPYSEMCRAVPLWEGKGRKGVVRGGSGWFGAVGGGLPACLRAAAVPHAQGARERARSPGMLGRRRMPPVGRARTLPWHGMRVVSGLALNNKLPPRLTPSCAIRGSPVTILQHPWTPECPAGMLLELSPLQLTVQPRSISSRRHAGWRGALVRRAAPGGHRPHNIPSPKQTTYFTPQRKQ